MTDRPLLTYRCGLCNGRSNRIAVVFDVDGLALLVSDYRNSDFGAKPAETVRNETWCFPVELESGHSRTFQGMQTTPARQDPRPEGRRAVEWSVEMTCRRHGWWQFAADELRGEVESARSGGRTTVALIRPPGQEGKLLTDPIERARRNSARRPG